MRNPYGDCSVVGHHVAPSATTCFDYIDGAPTTCGDCQYCLAEQAGSYISYYCSATPGLHIFHPDVGSCKDFSAATDPATAD